ncbi:unnamed protein product [Ilex paraguariensis]|uniref:Uncharacterized protein n=1 Tax=Ilex paraguariensis TaxID=185542 RepID=A0ABC8S3V6_9AQUA
MNMGLKIVREGNEYYLVHQGEIQRYLSSRRQLERGNSSSLVSSGKGLAGPLEEEEPCMGILDRILFFIGDLEAASVCAKRSRVL